MNCKTTKTQPKTIEQMDKEILHNNKILTKILKNKKKQFKLKKNSLEWKKLEADNSRLSKQIENDLGDLDLNF